MLSLILSSPHTPTTTQASVPLDVVCVCGVSTRPPHTGCADDTPGRVRVDSHVEITFAQKEGEEYERNEERVPFDDTTTATNFLVPEYYRVYVLKCSDVEIDAEIDWVAYNMKNGKENYLSAGEMPLPYVYLFFFFVWGIFAALWAAILLKGRRKVNKIHILLEAFIIFAALALIVNFGTYVVMANRGGRMAMGVFFFIFTMCVGLLCGVLWL